MVVEIVWSRIKWSLFERSAGFNRSTRYISLHPFDIHASCYPFNKGNNKGFFLLFFLLFKGIVWFRWRGWDYTLKRATMMIKPKGPTTTILWYREIIMIISFLEEFRCVRNAWYNVRNFSQLPNIHMYIHMYECLEMSNEKTVF